MPNTPTDVRQISSPPAGWKPDPRPPLDSSRSVLEFLHRLLIQPAEEQANLDGLLGELSAAFAATMAGLATFPEGVPLSANAPPWVALPDSFPGGAVTVPCRAGGSCLLALVGSPERGGWLLWLEDAGRTDWSASEVELLVLAGQVLTHRWLRDEARAPWAVQLDRGIRRQRMDATARVVRRLAHDFGNILTGILGFGELALSQQSSSNSPLHLYLTEIHRGAQNGAEYTNQLRLLARRQATSNRSCHLAEALPPAADAAGSPRINLPADLPAVAMESEALRQVLTVVLDNAREAISAAGIVEVSARTAQVDDGEACRLLGDVRPGTHLEIRIADNGSGLTPEAQRLLFAEPFFSTKARKRGFGLAIAYGILSAHRGGLELLRRPEGGTIARLIVPVAATAVPS